MKVDENDRIGRRPPGSRAGKLQPEPDEFDPAGEGDDDTAQYDEHEYDTEESDRGNPMVAGIIVGFSLLVILGVYFAFFRSAEPAAPAVVEVPVVPEPPMVVEEPVAEPMAVVETAPAKPLRPIVAPPQNPDESDAVVRKAAEDVAPKLVQYLVPEHQIQKWVMTVDMLADGLVPHKYRPFDYALPRFDVRAEGEGDNAQLYPAVDNSQRASALIDAVTAIDPALVARYYRSWLPVFEEAFAELGKDGTFDDRARLAIERIAAVKPLAGEHALTKKGGVIYAFADEKLESASDVEKFVWRLGDDNARRLQKWLQAVRAASQR